MFFSVTAFVAYHSANACIMCPYNVKCIFCPSVPTCRICPSYLLTISLWSWAV
jgi:hypothetical protein